MPLSRDEVAHIAALARLDLKPDELDGMARDLARILEYVQRIAALDPGPAPSPAGPGDTRPADAAHRAAGGTDTTPAEAADRSPAGPDGTPLRDDVVRPSLSVADALRCAADHDESFFRVPAVIERGNGFEP